MIHPDLASWVLVPGGTPGLFTQRLPPFEPDALKKSYHSNTDETGSTLGASPKFRSGARTTLALLAAHNAPKRGQISPLLDHTGETFTNYASWR